MQFSKNCFDDVLRDRKFEQNCLGWFSPSDDKFSDLLLLWILLIMIRSDATLPKDCFGDVLRDRKIWTISSSDDMSLICNIHYAVDPVKCVHWREIDLNLPRTFDPKTLAWKWTYKVCYEHITGIYHIFNLILRQIFWSRS